MPLSDIATVSISSNTVATPEPGFGVPLILSATAAWTERTRSYTSMTGVASDFASSTAEYKAASALFAQNPPPSKIMIGRLANKPTLAWTLTPTATNTTVYTVKVNGTACNYTSDSDATAAEIVSGLKTPIDALSLGITTGGTSTLTITANAAGAWFAVSPADYTKLAIVQTHSDPGVAADLDAIALEDSSWYCVLNAFNSTAMAGAIAGWVESNEKLFLCDSQESNAALVATGSDTGGSKSFAKTAKDASRARTAVLFHNDNGEFAAAAWAGTRLPTDPGSENWMFCTLSGITPDPLTVTHSTNLAAKNCNYYYNVGPHGITAQGWVADGERIDIIRGRDWLKSIIQVGFFDVVSATNKVPYTDEGVARLEASLRGCITRAQRVGFLAASPAPVFNVVAVANVSNSDKSARTYKGLSWSAVAAGAINLGTITGNVTLS